MAIRQPLINPFNSSNIIKKDLFIPNIYQEKTLSNEKKAIEWLRCKQNPLYFIYNYCYLPETGTGGYFKVTPEILHPKIKTVIKAIFNFHKAILMASRQLGKSSVAALLIAWAITFYPGIRAIILNMKKGAALNNLATIKFIILKLPVWMVTNKPLKSKSDIVTYLTLYNDSKVEVFYPSTTHTANTLARSLTSPILYIDEAAFIRDMSDIFASAQQTLSKAREQAEANGYPFLQLVTSTPNGTTSIGKWFYDRWQGAIDEKLIYDNDGKLVENYKEILNDPTKNTYVKIKYHWSEDPTKNEKWYQEQCQEISDQRAINQELDLIFVGTQYCIFDDNTLSSFKRKKPIDSIYTPHNATLNIFTNNFNQYDYYLIGADTAESLQGAYCAIQIFNFHKFNQIAELQYRYGSYNAFGKDIDFVFRWLLKQVGIDNIILCVENNTIGRAPIEYLQQFANVGVPEKDQIDYNNYLYFEKDQNIMKDKYGIQTTGLSKPLMVGCLTQFINENPAGIKSTELIDQLSSIEKTTSGSIKSSGYSDLFMAACFCALVRNKKAMEILPLIETKTPSLQGQDFLEQYSELINTKSLKVKKLNKVENFKSDYSDEEILYSDKNFDDFFNDSHMDNYNQEESFIPFFTQ